MPAVKEMAASSAADQHRDNKDTTPVRTSSKIVVPLIVTAITALLYIVGMAYHESYLAAFGLLKSQFPISHEITLFKGFASLATVGISKVFYIFFVVIFVTIIAIVIETSLSKGKRDAAKSYIKNLLPIPKNTPGTSMIFRKIFVTFEITSIATVFFLLLILTILVSAHAGKAKAKSILDRCTRSSAIKTVINSKDKQSPIDGCPIACSSRQCAYISGKNVIIVNNDGTVYGRVLL